MNKEPGTNNALPTNSLESLVVSWGGDTSKIIYPDEKDIQQLKETSDNGDEDSFDIMADDITADFLENNIDEYKENIRIIRSRTGSKESKIEARNNQVLLFNSGRIAVSNFAGISEDLAVDQDQQARNHIREILARAQKNEGSEFSPLRTLGFIREDKNGEVRFRFPEEIMPKNTKEKYRAYINAVRTHLKVENAVRSGVSDKHALVLADQHRKIAHDSVTMELDKLLNMNDFDEMRRTVAKMRDGSFPNVATSEESRVNSKLQEGLSYSEAIRNHLFPEGEYLPDRDS